MGVNNFLQHSDIKNDDAKQRKVATEYVALCGFKNGEMGRGRKTSDNQNSMLTQSEIASQLEISPRTLKIESVKARETSNVNGWWKSSAREEFCTA